MSGPPSSWPPEVVPFPGASREPKLAATLAVLDVEQTLIGLVLADARNFLPELSAEHFYEPVNRRLWSLLGQLVLEGAQGPEVPALASGRMRDDPAMRELGGAARYIAELIDRAPMGADGRRLASEINNQAIERAAARVAEIDAAPTQAHLDWLRAQRDEAAALWSPKGNAWAKPFTWRPPASLPQRQWLYGGHYIRRFVTTTVAPGGLGKSSLTIAEALSMSSGKALLGIRPVERCRVWLWNGEDPLEETERRVHATMLHHQLSAADVDGWLFMGSGREAELIIAEQTREGAEVQRPKVEAIKRLIYEHQIDVVVIDPFVSSHRVSENDNNAVDRVAKTWARIADDTNTAIELVHHVRKGQGGGQEITVEDGRGAVALLAAARSARVLNPMSEDEAAKTEVERRRSYFRVDNGKANLAPPPDGSTWFHFVSVSLGNGDDGGDSVGVVEPWRWPSPLEDVTVPHLQEVQRRVADGSWRENPQAKGWVGHLIAEVLEVDLAKGAGKAKVKGLLKAWLKSGALKVEQRFDDNGDERPFVVVGEWVTL